MNKGTELFLAGLGIVLIFTFAFGRYIFDGMLYHITADLTDELGVHIYIAGWVLIFYGLYCKFKNKQRI